MCGRFYIDDETAREIEKIARKIDDKTAGRGDVHPSDSALVLKAAGGKMVSQVLKWGYESPQRRGVIFNARTETVRERPMFRYDYESRRCIVPARKFYEWKKMENGQKGRKEKYDFFAEGEILFMAGIWHKDLAGDRFTVLTREAAGCMKEIHDRMPLLLTGGDIEKWLFSRKEADRLLSGSFDRLQRRRSGGEEYRQLCLF